MRRPGLNEATDRDLADALLKRGDEPAFRELYRRHTPRLYQFVLRMLGGAEAESEDVVQETWIRAADRLSGFRWESQFATWLTGISVNLCRDRLRRDARRQELQPLDGVELHVRAGRHEDRIDLERAIALLPAGYREVLILHDVEGFTHGEIGERLGIAEGTSKSQLFFARRAMRSLLAPAREREYGVERAR
jgi:RNA polymerase sigma-70 factor (ECF subfamily)